MMSRTAGERRVAEKSAKRKRGGIEVHVYATHVCNDSWGYL